MASRRMPRAQDDPRTSRDGCGFGPKPTPAGPRTYPCNPWKLRFVAHLLSHDGVIAYPTEAVWGLGCDPNSEHAVRRLLGIKRRPEHKGLILIAATFDQLEPWVLPLDLPARQLVDATWPGPVTWVLPARSDTPFWLRGSHPGLAVRVTSHPVAAALCRAFGGALVSTSANRGGSPPLRTALSVRLHLGHEVDFIVPGRTGESIRPTEIRDLASGRVLRAG